MCFPRSRIQQLEADIKRKDRLLREQSDENKDLLADNNRFKREMAKLTKQLQKLENRKPKSYNRNRGLVPESGDGDRRMFPSQQQHQHQQHQPRGGGVNGIRVEPEPRHQDGHRFSSPAAASFRPRTSGRQPQQQGATSRPFRTPRVGGPTPTLRGNNATSRVGFRPTKNGPAFRRSVWLCLGLSSVGVWGAKIYMSGLLLALS